MPNILKNPKIDILVNNAGLALGVGNVDTNKIEDAITVMQTNLLAVIHLCTIFTPGMKERNFGHVINISSVAGNIINLYNLINLNIYLGTEAYEGGTIYCASKFAINGFSIASRMDLVATPVRVTTISPGMVETEFS